MFKFVLAVLFVVSVLSAQEKKEEIVAKAGNVEISASEFLYRFQLNPQMSIHRIAQGEANKKNFLYGLLAEKLLAADAAEHVIDTISAVKYFLKNIEKMFVRDELYRQEIKEKSKDEAEKRLAFYLENSSRIFTKGIITDSEKKANDFYSLLSKGIPFDSIYYELTPSERDTITLYSGYLDDKTEFELFSLPEKSFSKPIRYDNHFVIFYVEQKNDPVIARSMGWEQEYKRLNEAASARAEGIFYKYFLSKFFVDKKVNAKGFFIKSMAEKFHTVLSEQDLPDTGKIIAGSSDIIHVTRMFSDDSLHMEFIQMPGNPVHLQDFLQWLRMENFELKENTYNHIAALLNSKVKTFIEYELLSREGYRRGLDKTPEVRKQFSMWRDNYLYQLRVSQLSDSLKTDSRNILVRAAVLKNSDLGIIEEVLNQTAAGADFINLAFHYSDVEPDTSLRMLSSFGELQDEMVQVEEGNVFGPISASDGYALIKILEKSDREIPGIKNGSAGSIDNPFDKYIAGLAKKYGVSIDESVLKSVRSSNINAMVFKYLGFGGRLPAVPLIVPMSGWILEYNKEIKLNP